MYVIFFLRLKAHSHEPVVKNLPAMQEMLGFDPWVGKIPLEEGMATHSSILAWRIPMDRGAWQATYSPWGYKELDMTE